MESEDRNVTLSPSVIPDLIDLVKDPKFEVKKGALALILQFCTLPAHRKLFETSEIIKLLLRSLPEEDLETISLSNLISFSQDEWACRQITELNGLDRLMNLFSTLVSEGSFSETQKLMVELALLLLSNLTQSREGVMKFLHLETKEHLGVHFIFLFDKFVNPKLSEIFKFAGNVFSNITAIKEARDLLILPEYKVISNLMTIVDTSIKEIRLGALRSIRNLAFEYENGSFLDQILDEKTQFMECLTNIMGEISIFCNVIDAKIKADLKNVNVIYNENKAWKDVKFLEEIVIVLDIILVLTNINEIEKKIKFNHEKLTKILLILKPLVPGEIKDKIDVILCLFCQINPENH